MHLHIHKRESGAKKRPLARRSFWLVRFPFRATPFGPGAIRACRPYLACAPLSGIVSPLFLQKTKVKMKQKEIEPEKERTFY
jgi:hypothetical protein